GSSGRAPTRDDRWRESIRGDVSTPTGSCVWPHRTVSKKLCVGRAHWACPKAQARSANRAVFWGFRSLRPHSARGMRRTRTEYLRANAHIGCTKGHRRLEVRAHAHAELSETELPRELGKESKMHSCFLLLRRNAHEPSDVELEVLATEPQQTRRFLRIDACLLSLRTRVDLDEQLEPPLLLCHLKRDGLGNPRPVNRVNGIKQRHRLACLVGLQWPDQMQLDVGKA